MPTAKEMHDKALAAIEKQNISKQKEAADQLLDIHKQIENACEKGLFSISLKYDVEKSLSILAIESLRKEGYTVNYKQNRSFHHSDRSNNVMEVDISWKSPSNYIGEACRNHEVEEKRFLNESILPKKENTTPKFTFKICVPDNRNGLINWHEETISQSIVKIGKDPKAHLTFSTIQDSSIARLHAVIEAPTSNKDPITIIDLGNGILVNKQKVDSARIKEGDVITIGNNVTITLVSFELI